MNAIQLDLFSGMPTEITIPEPTPKKDAVQLDTTSTPKITDPCKGCDLKEWCSWDDCAQHIGPLDIDHEVDYRFGWENGTRFSNLEEFIRFKKWYGWM